MKAKPDGHIRKWAYGMVFTALCRHCGKRIVSNYGEDEWWHLGKGVECSSRSQ